MRDDPWTAANRDKERVPCAHSGRDAIVGPESAHTSAVVESLGPIPIGALLAQPALSSIPAAPQNLGGFRG